MELNPTLVGVIGLVVFLLGLAMKRFNWELNDRRLLWTIVGLSIVGGIAQVALNAGSPLPPMPTEPGQFLAWLAEVVGWLLASSTAVFGASQIIYALIMKGIAPAAE